jgi:DNA-binding response OmpR family regulator
MLVNSKPKKVLIVDDEPDILTFLQAMLEDAGYSVITMEKSDSVEQFVGEHLPDLLLLDMLLSGKDGRAIARKLKSQEHTRLIPIIMVSAHPGAERESQAAGADDYLAKPFDMDELFAKIEKYV